MLALLLAPVLLVTLVASQACGTLLSPGFYKDQLREAEIYTFLYDELLTSAVADALETDEGLPPGVDLDADAIVDSLREAAPPDWLQEQVEGAIDSVGPYLLGSSDSFSYSVGLDERAGAAEAAASALLERVDLHEALFAEEVPGTVERRLGDGELPLGIHLTKDEAVAVVEKVVTPEHVRSQQSSATEALTAFLVGRNDTFNFTFSMTERTSTLEQELRQIFDDADIEVYVRREVLEPALDENVTADVAMPLGVVVSKEEIRAAIEAAATSEWLQFETLRLVDSVVPYLSARADAFNLTVPLVERTDAAIRELTITVEDKYGALIGSLPQCTPAQLRQLAQGQGVDLCLPQGFTTQDFLGAVGIDVEASLAGPVHEMTPDEVTFTEADLLAETLGTPAGDSILELRETMRDGLTFDEEGIREALAEQDPELPDALVTLREGFQVGWTWTEADLRDLVQDRDFLDQARGAVGTFKLLVVLISLFAVAMVAGSGFLGGRSWGGRLGWAGGALAFAALCTFIVAGPIYVGLASGPLEDAREDIRIGGDETERLALDKLLDTLVQATDDIMGGIRLRALLLLVLGVAGVAGGIYLRTHRLWRSRPPRAAEPPPAPTPPEEGAATAAVAFAVSTEETTSGEASEAEVAVEGEAAEAEDATVEAEPPVEGEAAEAADAAPESSPEDDVEGSEDGPEKPQTP